MRATALFPIYPAKTFAPRYTSIYSPFRAQQHKNFSFWQSLKNAEYYPTTRLTTSQFHFSISNSFFSSFCLRPNCNKKHITTPIASAKHTFYLYFLSVNRATNSFQFLFYSLHHHKNKNIFFTDHWSKHRKTAGSLSFLGGTAYNADIAQRCAALRRRSKKPLCIFHHSMLYLNKALR